MKSSMKLWRTFAVFLLGAGIGSASVVLLPRIQYEVASRLPKKKTFINESFPVSKDPYLGSETAPLTIVEFSDFECPYCKMFAEEILPSLKTEFIDTGKVRFIHKDLPLPFHPNAFKAARLARCSNQDGEYWESYNKLFKSQECLTCKGPEEILGGALLTKQQTQQCLSEKSSIDDVQANLDLAKRLQINGTPTFVIGPTQKEGHQGEVISGVVPWETFKEIIERKVKAAPTSRENS